MGDREFRLSREHIFTQEDDDERNNEILDNHLEELSISGAVWWSIL